MTVSDKSSLGMPGWLFVIAVMTGIGPVSIDLYLPAFPSIEAAFGEHGVERTMASYLIGLAIGQLLYGPISDRFGRKPPLYFGFAIYTIGASGCALANNMTILIAFRVVQALGACSGIAIGRAVVRDRCEPEQAARAFSTLMMIVAVAPILAPIAGGFIVTAAGWRTAFWFQAALGLVVLVAIHFVMTESLDAKHVRPLHLPRVLRAYLSLCKDRQFLGHTLIGGFAMAALFCYVSGAPTVLTRTYEISPQHFGWLIGLNGLAFMTASRLNLRSFRTSTPAALLAKFVWLPTIVGAALVGLNLAPAVPLTVVVIAQFCFFISTARVLPNTSALALAHHGRDAGTASALLGALQSVIATGAGIAVATLNNGTVFRLGLLMTTFVVTSGLLHVWTTKAMGDA